MRKAPAYTLIATVCLLPLALAKWARLPGIDKKPVSMGLVLNGTIVEKASGIDGQNNLILGDPVKPVKLAAGKSEAVIKFVRQSLVKSASFVNDGLEGKVEAGLSTDGKAWSTQGSAVFSPADRLVKLDLGAAQGRYLRLQFQVVRSGTIRGLQIFGADNESNYTVTQNDDGSGAPVNFASGIGGGRLIYLNPEQYSSRGEAIASSQLSFPESDEKYRTAVYDLGQIRSLKEFSSVHSSRPVRLNVYTFDVLPEKEDWRGRLAFDASALENATPVASAEDTQGSGHLTIKPDKPVKTRYVAMRWEPDFNPPAFEVFNFNIGGAAVTVYNNTGFSATSSTNSSGNPVVTVTDSSGNTATITIMPNGDVVTQGFTGSTGTGGDAGGGQGGGSGGESGGNVVGGGSINITPFNGAPSAGGVGANVGVSQ